MQRNKGGQVRATLKRMLSTVATKPLRTGVLVSGIMTVAMAACADPDPQNGGLLIAPDFSEVDSGTETTDGCEDPEITCRDPSPEERRDIEDTIMMINPEVHQTCADLKGFLETALTDGRILVYEGDDGNWGAYHPTLRRVRLWEGHWGTGGGLQELGWTTIHEGAHSQDVQHGSFMEWLENNCIEW